MDAWLSTLLTVFGMLAATWLANRKSTRDMATQWEREDSTRWDEKRLAAYSTFIGHVLSVEHKLDIVIAVGRKKAGSLELVDPREIIDDIRTIEVKQGELSLLAGSDDITSSAREVITSLRRYMRVALMDDDAEEEEIEAQTREEVAPAIREGLNEFTSLVRDQLGVTKKS